MQGNNNVWSEYLDEFSYLSENALRKDNHPQKMVHPHPVEDSIVLIHGLTDSPALMADLAQHYYDELGYNVYLPLLQSHGLREPDGMRGVSLNEWKKNIRFALQTAADDTKRLSIGGLSMGGAFAFYFGCLDGRVNHKIFLFSASLGLSGGWVGTLKEMFLRSPFQWLFARLKRAPLVGDNPYRYSHVPLNSARELALLIKEIDGIRSGGRSSNLLSREIFSAWSECDDVVDTEVLANLSKITAPSSFTPFVIDEKHRVDHACVVLKHSVYALDARPGSKALERANPMFEEMVARST